MAGFSLSEPNLYKLTSSTLPAEHLLTNGVILETSDNMI